MIVVPCAPSWLHVGCTVIRVLSLFFSYAVHHDHPRPCSAQSVTYEVSFLLLLHCTLEQPGEAAHRLAGANSHRKSVPFCSGVRRPANVQGPVRSEEGKAAACRHRDRGHAGAGAGEHGCSPFVQALGLPRCFGAHTQPLSPTEHHS